MAAAIGYETFGNQFTALSSELNSLANNGIAVSIGVFDNSSARDFHCLVELVSVMSGAPSANGTIDVYAVPSLDGTNFDIGAVGSFAPSDALLLATFQPPQAASSRMVHRAEILTPGLYKVVVVNRVGVTMAASASTVTIRQFSDESV
jgi:hypothetical protein